MTVVGHDMVQRSIAVDLPPVVLLQGPTSVGKRTLCEETMRQRKARPTDTQVHKQLTTDAARELRRFFSTAPFGPFKAALIDLDGAQQGALNALLKVLEEPPTRTHVLMWTSRPTLLTIRSRARAFTCGYLTDAQVARILRNRFGMSEEDAAQAAAASGGQVSRAIESADIQTTKAPVLSLLKAAATGNEVLFQNALQAWGPRENSMLSRWAVEARTGQWRIFSREESFGLANRPVVPDRILRAMRTGARPKLTAKLALADILEGNR